MVVPINTNQFIISWRDKKDHDGSRAVGIGVNWNKIALTSKVVQYIGQDAWERIGDFYAPVWGGFKRTTLKEWLNPDRDDYNKFIAQEKAVGKISLYKKHGLIYTDFCAFADISGRLGVLGDGCHRFIDINYLIMQGEIDKDEIKKSKLDVIYLENLEEVLGSLDYEIIAEAQKALT